jgi:hypothetical protein
MTLLKADPQSRRKLVNIYVVIFIVGFIIIQWGLPEFKAFANQKKPREAVHVLLVTVSICFLSVLPMAIYVYRYGQRILKAGQCPPPGEKVIRDTNIIEGDAARRRGQMLIMLSLLLALASLFGGLFIPYGLYKSFDSHQINKKSVETRKAIAEKTPM